MTAPELYSGVSCKRFVIGNLNGGEITPHVTRLVLHQKLIAHLEFSNIQLNRVEVHDRKYN